MEIRLLTASDQEALDAFLRPLTKSSMLLRSNLRRGGLMDEGKRHQGTYAAALDDRGEIRGVVAHYWNGMVIPQARPDIAGVLARFVVGVTARRFAGSVGPAQQVGEVLASLKVTASELRANHIEGLYVLALHRLRWPVREPALQARPVHPRDREPLVSWFDAYAMETLGAASGSELRANSEQAFERACGDPPGYVLMWRNQHVAYSTFNATVPEAVQVGGVFTPPELRAMGFARQVVAQSLTASIATGVDKAVLFTPDHNTPAIRAYTALGFERIGDFRLTMCR